MKKDDQIELIARGLISMKGESSTCEFKMNQASPEEIGIRISALSNMAAIEDAEYGYIIWGVRDSDYKIIGTDLSFKTWKNGNEDIIPYFENCLSPHIILNPYEITIDGKHMMILEIPAAAHYATLFKGTAYCRIESYTKDIRQYPELEKKLFARLSDTSAEKRIVLSSLDEKELFSLLDFNKYYDRLGLPVPGPSSSKIASFVREGFLVDESGGRYSVTALGALLFAKDLNYFQNLSTKIPRLIRYNTKMRDETMGRASFSEGYALDFENMQQTVLSYLAKPDVFENGIRKNAYDLPEIAVRECLGNLLIHQDLLSNGTPLIEIFPDRVEFTNPGELSIPADRVIDVAPSPKNPLLASFLRRINIGDTAGTGFDKIVASMERMGLAAPKVESALGNCRVILYRNKRFDTMEQDEKLLSVYDHCVLLYVSNMNMTNTTLRERFKLGDEAKYKISRLISLAVNKGLIKKRESTDRKDASYIPYWA